MLKKVNFNIILAKLYSLKKRTFAYGIIAILGTFFIMGANNKESKLKAIPPLEGSCKAIIFDLGDVIFETSQSAQRLIIGPTILWNPSLLYHLMRIDVKETFFDILRKIPAKTTEPIYNKGKEMPQILNDWMTGRSSLMELKLLVCSQVHQSNHPTALKNLFLNVAHFMFDEQCIAQAQLPINPMVKLLQELKRSGYKVYILSNWDPYSFARIQEKHPAIFSHCDGVMISGQEQVSKPNPDFFNRLMTKYKLKPEECVFIDDEPYNIISAQQLGIKAILHINPTMTLKELIRCRIMKLTD